jgi:hypothetical protein
VGTRGSGGGAAGAGQAETESAAETQAKELVGQALSRVPQRG